MASKSDYEKRHEAEKAVYDRKTDALAAVIKPLRTATYEVDYEWTSLRRALDGLDKDYDGLELNPDFQRGHVWTPRQQEHFVENVLRGVIASSGFLIQFNCPNWNKYDYQPEDGGLPRGVQCVDGLQRITAMFAYLDGQVRPFGYTVSDLEGSGFSVKRYRFKMAMHDFQSRADLLQHYLDLNAGGTPHSDAELIRVRAMQAEAQSARIKRATGGA